MGTQSTMTRTESSSRAVAHSNSTRKVYELVTALSMTMGRGRVARLIADLAVVNADDYVVDVGCGPGTAVREAARRGAMAIGIDPAPTMLRFGHWITSIQRQSKVTLVEGSAEALPLSDASATIVWSLSSVHHWADRSAGLSEARRVLATGGRILLAERLVKPGAQGHAAHGLTRDQAHQLAADLKDAGFTNVHIETHTAGRRNLIIIRGTQ